MMSGSERILAAAGAALCFGLAGWLMWAEWGPNGRARGDGWVRVSTAMEMLATARTHIEAKRWEAAQQALDAVTKAPEAEHFSDEAASLRTMALLERRNRSLFEGMQRSLVDGDTESAQMAFRSIPDSSVYRAAAVKIMAEVR